jgi:hypothetical protein
MTSLTLCHTAWLTGWLLVMPALAILVMCHAFAVK